MKKVYCFFFRCNHRHINSINFAKYGHLGHIGLTDTAITSNKDFIKFLIKEEKILKSIYGIDKIVSTK